MSLETFKQSPITQFLSHNYESVLKNPKNARSGATTSNMKNSKIPYVSSQKLDSGIRRNESNKFDIRK